jgi:uncharacterized protein YjiS (DUF1127 family)
MSYAAHRRDFGSLVGQVPCKTEEGSKRVGILRRIRDAFIESRRRATARLPAPVASRLAELRSGWKHRAGRRRLARSIAHLDDRLLADIGLGPEDLGFAERLARRRATGLGIWAGSKAGPGTDWQ